MSQATLLRAVRDGRLQPTVITAGGHYRFSEEHLRSWAAGGENGTTAYAPIENNFRLFTSDGLAKRLRVSQATVIRAVKRGLITPSVVTPGGHYRFSPNDVAQAASALGQMGSREPVAMGSAAPALQPEPQAAVDPVTVAEPAPNCSFRRVVPASGGHRARA